MVKKAIMIMNNDPFLEICKLKGCNNINCSTCGHAWFRYAFIAVTNTIDFEDGLLRFKDTLGRCRLVLKDGSLSPCVQKYCKNRSLDLSEEEKIKLVEVVSKTDLLKVHQEIQDSERWLKALGLVLYHTQDNEEATKILSDALIPQFKILLDDEYLYPHEKLTWQSLEHIEWELQNKKI